MAERKEEEIQELANRLKENSKVRAAADAAVRQQKQKKNELEPGAERQLAYGELKQSRVKRCAAHSATNETRNQLKAARAAKHNIMFQEVGQKVSLYVVMLLIHIT